MVDEAECRHEMNPAWCALCLGQVRNGGALADDSWVSSPFAARYRSMCETCEIRIEPDDMVCLVKQDPADHGVVVHEDCVGDV